MRQEKSWYNKLDKLGAQKKAFGSVVAMCMERCKEEVKRKSNAWF